MKRDWKVRVELPAYTEYVEHPRYGRSPIITGLDVVNGYPGVSLHWNTCVDFPASSLPLPLGISLGHSDASWPVQGTAIVADVTRQKSGWSSVTHYYDIDRRCVGCSRRFLFFAREQKHWYEELGFQLEAQAVRCHSCRKKLQQISRRRRRYKELVQLAAPTGKEMVALATCCLFLVEEGIFHRRQIEHVRTLLNRLADQPALTDEMNHLRRRVLLTEMQRNVTEQLQP